QPLTPVSASVNGSAISRPLGSKRQWPGSIDSKRCGTAMIGRLSPLATTSVSASATLAGSGLTVSARPPRSHALEHTGTSRPNHARFIGRDRNARSASPSALVALAALELGERLDRHPRARQRLACEERLDQPARAQPRLECGDRVARRDVRIGADAKAQPVRQLVELALEHARVEPRPARSELDPGKVEHPGDAAVGPMDPPPARIDLADIEHVDDR